MIKPDSLSSAHILIVDDQETNTFLLTELLREEGFTNLVATTDSKQVEQLYREQNFDLIVLDLQMPAPDGFEIMARLRAVGKDIYLPILVLTVQTDPEYRLRALQSGAKDFLTKPFDRVEVVTRIRNMLEIRAIYNVMLEQNSQLSNNAVQLKAINKELESFSYSVAHDLRAPLRRLDGFSKLLLKDYEETLGESGKSLLDSICRQTKHMGSLINDLLCLSQISRNTLQRQKLDLSVIATGVINQLKEAEPQRSVYFETRPNLFVHADPGLMNIVLTNLISNAWKYSRTQERAHIQIGLENLNGKEVFFIRDNGVGFDMKYAENLFSPFFRMHSTIDYQGNGIGLATVQRIVHRHGGNIWAEAAPNKGATFYLVLPTPH